MGLFHKDECDQLKRKTKVMYDIDNQEDNDTDALLIYAPKRAKVSSIDSLYSEHTNREIYEESKKKSRKSWLPIVIGLIILGFVVLLIIALIK